MNKAKLIIVSNRLPIKIDIKKGQWQIKPSEGGLATGLVSFYKDQGGVWIGWPGAQIKDNNIIKAIQQKLAEESLIPIFLSHQEIKEYYEGFSNQTLWPLFHYFPSYATYEKKQWETYYTVNQKFAEAVIRIAQPGDTVWIHDYQLMLVPSLIREKLQGISIGYFQHIPFPSYEVFRLIPWRNQLLKGLLGADLIGFHTYDDVRHFISAIIRIMDVQSNMNIISFDKRIITTEAFPMGIDYAKYSQQPQQPATQKYIHKILKGLEGKKLMISIDRLDYSKGILQRLSGYQTLLENYPEYREKIVYYQLIVPSRDKVYEYDLLKQEIDKLVSHINAKYGTLSWQPIQYFYKAWSFDMLSALYYTADIAIVTPLRDGMNLVCKEYIASKTNITGVLILSEMAGAARELTEAVIINPNDTEGMAAAIACALTMPEEEKSQRLKIMQKTIKRFDINMWVSNFLKRLEDTKKQQKDLSTKSINSTTINLFKTKYRKSASRLFFLDYDGTLVPFEKDPNKALPSNDLLKLLHQLTNDTTNKIVIISGRNRQLLETWLKDLPIDIIAEHGAWSKKYQQKWQIFNTLDNNNQWKNDIRPVMEQYEARTPGSFIEEKDFSLAWHFRKVENSLADLRSKEIVSHLKNIIADKGLQILEGHKVIEVKSTMINKGKAVQKWIKQFPSDFYMAIGDDTTDEDTFKAMPENSITIKVGKGVSAAKYYIDTPDDVLQFLHQLSQ